VIRRSQFERSVWAMLIEVSDVDEGDLRVPIGMNLSVERRPARAPARIGRATGEDPPVPARRRLWREQERLPRPTR